MQLCNKILAAKGSVCTLSYSTITQYELSYGSAHRSILRNNGFSGNLHAGIAKLVKQNTQLVHLKGTELDQRQSHPGNANNCMLIFCMLQLQGATSFFIAYPCFPQEGKCSSPSPLFLNPLCAIPHRLRLDSSLYFLRGFDVISVSS